MERLSHISLDGKNYPLLCDLNVLERIQEEFGTVNAFELAILGIKMVKDADGRQRYFENGNPMIESVEPSIKAIRLALVEMVNEGIAYENYYENKSWDRLDDLDIISCCRVPFSDLATLLHDEYKKCFETKKATPREAKVRKSQK